MSGNDEVFGRPAEHVCAEAESFGCLCFVVNEPVDFLELGRKVREKTTVLAGTAHLPDLVDRSLAFVLERRLERELCQVREEAGKLVQTSEERFCVCKLFVIR
jgi:hypothetical protein